MIDVIYCSIYLSAHFQNISITKPPIIGYLYL